MALVDYSDSDSNDEDQSQTSKPTVAPKPSALPSTKFTADKDNPRKIRISLPETDPKQISQRDTHGEPAPKRTRVGGSAFSDFNAMLPAPKNDADRAKATSSTAGKAVGKVFSLKTGAEPGFSRESDAELRDLFAEQNILGAEDLDSSLRSNTGKATFTSAQISQSGTLPGTAMRFKPLSVARNPQRKKKSAVRTVKTHPVDAITPNPPDAVPVPAPPPAKISLFSAGSNSDLGAPVLPEAIEEDVDEREDVDIGQHDDPVQTHFPTQDSNSLSQSPSNQPQSLENIASDLNLSAAARRQLLGRHGTSSTVINVVNFNTDAEYAANELFRQSGEQVQHNPVRAIATGKHSLKQLVSAATGQKEALEESFASGKRNKREAGNKYGW